MVAVCAWLVALAGSGCGLSASRLADSDGDGLSDLHERRLGTDPLNADSDFDGRRDGDELVLGTSPLSRDSDGDGIDDGEDEVNDPPSPRTGSGSSGNDLEPNDAFPDAVVLINPDEDALTIEGRIDQRDDVDVFDIGPMRRGDRVRVDFIRRDVRFRARIAIFDAAESVFAAGVDPYVRGGPDIPAFLDARVRHGGERYYVAVTHPAADAALGSYELQVTIERDAGAAPPATQALVLSFGGGVLDVPVLGRSVIAPFDPGNIDARYEPESDSIRDAIVATVRDDFAGLDVLVLTDEDETPAGVAVSTIHFGSFSALALGAAESVDAFNVDGCDDGVVFIESFRSVVFGFLPTADALGVAIGNVAAHESGHLLGLRHVNDAAAIMDELSPGVHLLSDQAFRLAPLADSVFPIGMQDGPRILAETVGRTPAIMAP